MMRHSQAHGNDQLLQVKCTWKGDFRHTYYKTDKKPFCEYNAT